MRMTQSWLEERLKENPALSYTIQGGAADAQAATKQDEDKSACETNKYKAKKLYVFESGCVSENKGEPGQGRIIQVFASQKEYLRWQELLLLQKSGKIRELKRQVPLVVMEAFQYEDQRVRPTVYVADFTYIDCAGTKIVEDVKGYDVKTQKYRTTEAFRLKWKMLKRKYPQCHFVLY